MHVCASGYADALKTLPPPIPLSCRHIYSNYSAALTPQVGPLVSWASDNGPKQSVPPTPLTPTPRRTAVGPARFSVVGATDAARGAPNRRLARACGGRTRAQLGRIHYPRMGHHWQPVSGAKARPRHNQPIVHSSSRLCAFSRQPYNLSRDGYVKANVGGTSLYRVNYPANMWAALRQSIAAQVRRLLCCGSRSST